MAFQQDLSSGLGVSFPVFGLRDSSLTDHQELYLALNGISADDITYTTIFADHCISSQSIIYLFICLIGLLYHF